MRVLVKNNIHFSTFVRSKIETYNHAYIFQGGLLFLYSD